VVDQLTELEDAAVLGAAAVGSDDHSAVGVAPATAMTAHRREADEGEAHPTIA
jgi:hypothetical protein